MIAIADDEGDGDERLQKRAVNATRCTTVCVQELWKQVRPHGRYVPEPWKQVVVWIKCVQEQWKQVMSQ